MEVAVLKLGYFIWTETTLMGHVCSRLLMDLAEALPACTAVPFAHLILLSPSVPLVIIPNKYPECQTPSYCLLLENLVNESAQESLWGPPRVVRLPLLCPDFLLSRLQSESSASSCLFLPALHIQRVQSWCRTDLFKLVPQNNLWFPIL